MIVGILTTIAYPSYLNYLLKTRRADGLTVLIQDQILLERCYAQNFSYKSACEALPVFPQLSPQGFYSISLSNYGISTYTLTATPVGSQIKDTQCAGLTVNEAGVKTAVDVLGSTQTICWKK